MAQYRESEATRDKAQSQGPEAAARMAGSTSFLPWAAGGVAPP
jgi:hypothetical protein